MAWHVIQNPLKFCFGGRIHSPQSRIHLIPVERSPPHHHVPFLSLYILTLSSLPLFYVDMPAFRIYFSLPCSSFPLLTHHMCLRLSIVLPSISHFPPPCFCVTKYYVFSRCTSLHSFLQFRAIFNYMYVFFLSRQCSSSLARHTLQPHHIVHHTYSFPSTHTHHHSHFLLPL